MSVTAIMPKNMAALKFPIMWLLADSIVKVNPIEDGRKDDAAWYIPADGIKKEAVRSAVDVEKLAGLFGVLSWVSEKKRHDHDHHRHHEQTTNKPTSKQSNKQNERENGSSPVPDGIYELPLCVGRHHRYSDPVSVKY